MHVKDFVLMANENSVLSYKRGWIPAKPLPSPFVVRLRDAWQVLLGNAEAVEFDDPGEIVKGARKSAEAKE